MAAPATKQVSFPWRALGATTVGAASLLAICCGDRLELDAGVDAAGHEEDADLPRDAPSDDAASAASLVRLYTAQRDDTIVTFSLDARDGALRELGRTPIAGGASFVAFDPSGRRAAAVLEDGHEVVALAPDARGVLHELGVRRSAQGMGPTHVSIDPSGAFALVADYGSGDVATFPFAVDGSLGEAAGTARPGANAHQIVVAPSGTLALVPCKGDDLVAVLAFDPASGALGSRGRYETEGGQGPRHLVITADARHVYLANELGSRLEVLALEGASGTLARLQSVSTIPSDFTESNTAAEIALGVGERFLYVSNRGHDSIAIFEIGADHLVVPRGHARLEARRPRSFAIDPSGAWLFAGAQDDDVIVPFAIGADGSLVRRDPIPTSGSPTFVGVFAISPRT